MSGRHVALPRQLKLQGKVVAGRYLVEELIGIGGMAVVFRGQHMGLGRAVAIKVLRPEYGDNPEIAHRFTREARASSGFDHPNCRAVLDCGELENGLKFMAMQLLEGRELAKVLGKPLPPSQCIALTLQVLRGLDHAHRHGVVHRDLKPDNLFVTKDHHDNDLLKIVDFGIARIVDEKLADGLTTKVGAIVGTPAYMSPEQALGEDIDGRADLYSVGMILYEMLTGAPPFSSTEARELMKAHVAGRIPPLPPTVPPLVNAGLGTTYTYTDAVETDITGNPLAGSPETSFSLGAQYTFRIGSLNLTPHPVEKIVEIARRVGARVLFDTGFSDVYQRNAEHAGIDLETADAVAISHFHRDHTRGCRMSFLRDLNRW